VVLTEEDIKSNKYSITDVVLPLPGHAVIYPTNEIGKMYRYVEKYSVVCVHTISGSLWLRME
jgi:hypothetical protein